MIKLCRPGRPSGCCSPDYRRRRDPDVITEELISSYLYTRDLPDPDMVIRTAGEMRVSNFLLWQSAYSEYYATPTLWPDFGREDLRKALESYRQRQRRVGSLSLVHDSRSSLLPDLW